ncbi:Casein kinase I isoform delta-like [Zea mays]|uniref:Casein kinase I isoform delta-like n=1 Tax=Zea mays TaxID=4577 RepID=A0A1D6MF26_MAIZE|nr:Casein kinase I isoform delta-like [Zea mays]
MVMSSFFSWDADQWSHLNNSFSFLPSRCRARFSNRILLPENLDWIWSPLSIREHISRHPIHPMTVGTREPESISL